MGENETTQNKAWAIYLGPIAAAVLGFTLLAMGMERPVCWTAAVTTLVAMWWIFEPVPIPVTSLVPFALFPLVGVLDFGQAASAFGHHIILLTMGGFMISTAMEKSGAHRRLALGMVHAVGGRGGRRLVLGFMLAVALLSLWISNIAAMLMILPIAMAVLEEAEDKKLLCAPLLLGMAYAASIGGIGTPIGTPPNLIFMAAYKEATGQDISFFGWMKLGLPVVIILIPIVWLWLTRGLGKAKEIEVPHPGPWRSEEKRVLAVFTFTALAWIFRKEPFGGWSSLIGSPGVGDSTVALMSVIAMFLIPNGHGGRLLNWKTASKIPWGLMLLVGGGITIARAFGASGLSEVISHQLTGLSKMPVVIMIAVLSLAVMFMTEVTTNMATTALLMPLLAAAGISAGLDPALLMVPATISASCAFMLPAGTFPNAVVYGTGYVSIRTMTREGFPLKFIGAIVVTGVCYLLLAT